MGEEIERLRKRNKELEREVHEGKQREALLQNNLTKATAKLRVVEEAEERLSSEIGDLEADSLERARAYEVRVRQLTEELAMTHRIMAAYGIKLSVLNDGDD